MKIKPLLLLLCFFAGNVLAAPTTPTSDFIDNRDGTVTHKTTGLTWMRCALGRTWTGSTCLGTASTHTYAQAVALTGTFAGHGDWRVPNIAELQTIVERKNIKPAINNTIFPNTPNNVFWSSSPGVGYTSSAWYVFFGDGGVGGNGYRNNRLPVRLVRASQSLGIGLSTPNTDFTDNKDGTVTHKRTGLVWQRCAVGQTWTGSTCSGSANTYTYDAAQQVTSSLAGYSDWRVPTANELAGIVKYDASYPAINRRMFPNTPSNAFWSSSPYVGDTGDAWFVNFDHGFVSSNYRYNSLPVRLVRASQSSVIGPKPDLDTTMTATTARVKLNQNLTYTATVTNQGTAAATNTTLIFYFPPRWTNYVTVPSDCVSNGTSYRCSVATLAAGASLSKAITVNYARRGALNVVALGITDSDDADAANNKAQVMTTITP